MSRIVQSVVLMLLALAPAGCGRAQSQGAQNIGNAGDGAAVIAKLGCGACHNIPGIPDAVGRVGPPLDNIGVRTIIAGLLPNTPDNLVHWLRAPQSVVPGNAMPNMELDDHDARDVAAYLYTLR